MKVTGRFLDLSRAGKPVRTRKKHVDGTPCPEGTRVVPKGFKACCDFFKGHTFNCFTDLRFEWWGRNGWHAVISPQAGGGGVKIRYCPNCGLELEKAKKARR